VQAFAPPPNAGSTFVTLPQAERDAFWTITEAMKVATPVLSELRRTKASYVSLQPKSGYAGEPMRLGAPFPSPAGTNKTQSAVQRLFEAGIPGSAHWVYDGAFGVTLAEHDAGVSSWAEAEAWFAAHAPGQDERG
jgi:hypothetical protein